MLVVLKDVQLPDSMKCATARRAEAEREKRASSSRNPGAFLAHAHPAPARKAV